MPLASSDSSPQHVCALRFHASVLRISLCAQFDITPLTRVLTSDTPFLIPIVSRCRATLVLDLDETLVHSSFVPMDGAEDHKMSIDMEGSEHTVLSLHPQP